jgi:DNA polymerase-3 subunit gamma/tau
MSEYQVIARKYRPQVFKDVVGQEPCVRTLLNALSMKRVGHAYLFCGARGTGKTTLARLFAKALNCLKPLPSFEPCNECHSCKEIASSHCLDVIEIDGATHRGIEDVRQISETANYHPTSGKYKIYLIDEVHMLTKEAFNALLKLLEEPAAHIKFFFATTEPHKLPATILSRCQRFNLARIPVKKIEEKLAEIGKDLGVSADPAALHLIASHADGALRDAEVLFDQMISFYGNHLTAQSVEAMLGLLPEAKFFAFDQAMVAKDFHAAIKLAQEITENGRNIEAFIDELITHFRTILLLKKGAAVSIEGAHKEAYSFAIQNYSQEILISILNQLFEGAQGVRFAFSQSTYLEMLLINLVQSYHKPSLEILVERLIHLEKRLSEEAPAPKVAVKKEAKAEPIAKKEIKVEPVVAAVVQEKKETIVAAPAVAAPIVDDIKQKSRADTLVRFAAKELKGSVRQGER